MGIDNKNHITVIDSVMGSGKTSYAIQDMNANPHKKYLYITPLVDETERIVKSYPKLKFKTPEVRPNKTLDFINLLSKNENIACTHKLFEGMNSMLLEKLILKDYELIIDESLSVLHSYEYRNTRSSGTEEKDSDKKKNSPKDTHIREDVETLLGAKILSVNSDLQVEWVGGMLSKYIRMKDLAARGVLYYINNSALMWRFPPEVFDKKVFKKVTIMSYQFSYQLMSKYFDYFKIDYDTFYVRKNASGLYELHPYGVGAKHDLEFREFIKPKVHIIQDPKLNEVGDPLGKRVTSFSSSWYKSDTKDKMVVMNRNLESFFRSKTDTSADKRAIAVFKNQRRYLGMLRSNRNVSQAYAVPLNARATNEFRERNTIAYCVNRYVHPNTLSFFRNKGLDLNQEEFALSEMLQFIFRFAIRDDKDIYLYIPSYRMRTLLEMYLDGKEPSEFKSLHFSSAYDDLDADFEENDNDDYGW